MKQTPTRLRGMNIKQWGQVLINRWAQSTVRATASPAWESSRRRRPTGYRESRGERRATRGAAAAWCGRQPFAVGGSVCISSSQAAQHFEKLMGKCMEQLLEVNVLRWCAGLLWRLRLTARCNGTISCWGGHFRWDEEMSLEKAKGIKQCVEAASVEAERTNPEKAPQQGSSWRCALKLALAFSLRGGWAECSLDH